MNLESSSSRAGVGLSTATTLIRDTIPLAIENYHLLRRLWREEVVPVLRKEFDALRPAHVPDAPTHASLLTARQATEHVSA
ncbi:MAG: hypothetical protein ABIQ59_01785 [Nocardioidaceae bacterium]